MLLARNDDYSGIFDCLLNKKRASVLHRYTEIPCSIVIWNTHRNINKFKECQIQDDWVTWETVLFCCKYVLCGVLYEQLHQRIIQSSEHSTTATKSHMLFERIQSFSTGLSLISQPVIMLYEGIQVWRT